jgi:flavin-dependent dehydrogenase
MSESNHYDVLVVGAGPAGCATAIRTAQAGLSTVLLDRTRSARTWAGESLPPGMGKLMGSVFGDAILSEHHHRPAYGTRSVWGSAELAETDFITNPLGHGWLLDRARFDADVKAAAVAAGVTMAKVQRLGAVSRVSSAWQVETIERVPLTARFLVDATGRSAALLRQLRVGKVEGDRQVAIVATFDDDGDAYCGTTVEAVAEGWWYTTPLPGARRVLAYLTDGDLWRAGGTGRRNFSRPAMSVAAPVPMRCPPSPAPIRRRRFRRSKSRVTDGSQSATPPRRLTRCRHRVWRVLC